MPYSYTPTLNFDIKIYTESHTKMYTFTLFEYTIIYILFYKAILFNAISHVHEGLFEISFGWETVFTGALNPPYGTRRMCHEGGVGTGFYRSPQPTRIAPYYNLT